MRVAVVADLALHPVQLLVARNADKREPLLASGHVLSEVTHDPGWKGHRQLQFGLDLCPFTIQVDDTSSRLGCRCDPRGSSILGTPTCERLDAPELPSAHPQGIGGGARRDREVDKQSVFGGRDGESGPPAGPWGRAPHSDAGSTLYVAVQECVLAYVIEHPECVILTNR